jgi:hypothetical protein
MEENVSRNKKTTSEKDVVHSSRSSGSSSKVSGILKFVLGILLLPFVYAVSRAFINEFNLLERYLRISFSYGVASFLIVYLFIWEPLVFYKKGQQFVEIIFRFFAPLVKVASYVLPIYTVFLFIAGYLLSFVFIFKSFLSKFLFLIGFSIAFHLVFGAKSLKTRQGDFLRANYIFGFSLVYIINIFLLSFGFNLIFGKFSFVNFSNHSFLFAAEIFKAVFKQLFL